MDLISGTPFWLRKDGQPSSYPPLRDNESCDVLVIGGGVSGALIAHALVKAGVDTVLVDRRDIGTGSTAASTSLLQYEPDMPLWRLIRLRGENAAVASYRACRDAVAGIARLAHELGTDCHFTRRSSLKLASRARDVSPLRLEQRIRCRHGLPVEFWTRRKLRRESTLPHAGALLTPDAAALDAYALTHALLAASKRRGLRIYERTTITGLTPPRSRVIARTDRHRSIRAHRIVLAAGYEAARLLRHSYGSLHSTYAIATPPVDTFDGWPDDCLLWETARPYVYARRTNDSRAIIGGYDEPFRDPRRRDALLGAKAAALLRRLRAWFPNIDTSTAYAWTGTFAETEDSLPWIGTCPDDPRMYACLGYGGNGIVFSFIAAGIIRDLHLGIPNPIEPLFQFGR